MLVVIMLDTLLAPIVYAAIAGVYLVVVPFALYFYFKARWYITNSFERTFMCFLTFFFFPGLLLIGPFLNFRPEPRKI